MKKIFAIALLSTTISACGTFKSGEIPNSVIKYTVSERQKFLETGESKTVHEWDKGGISGIMYILKTTKSKDGTYCRQMYEHIVKGFKETELYNEWCRVGKNKWAIRVR